MGPEIAWSESDHDADCPLCHQEKHMRTSMTLYGHRVCSKCYYALANRRQLAYLIDVTALCALSVVSSVVLVATMALAGVPKESAGAFTGLVVLASPGIVLLKDSIRGHSPGKFVCGVRVIDRDTGQPVGLRASLFRTLPLLLPLVPIVVAFQLQRGRSLG